MHWINKLVTHEIDLNTSWKRAVNAFTLGLGRASQPLISSWNLSTYSKTSNIFPRQETTSADAPIRRPVSIKNSDLGCLGSRAENQDLERNLEKRLTPGPEHSRQSDWTDLSPDFGPEKAQEARQSLWFSSLFDPR